MYFTLAEFHSALIWRSIITVITLTLGSSSVDVIANLIQSSLLLSTEMRLFGNVMANGLGRWSRGWKIIDLPPLGGHYLKLSIEVMVPDIRRLMEKSESIFANHSRALPPQHRSKPQYEASRRSTFWNWAILFLSNGSNQKYVNNVLRVRIRLCSQGVNQRVFARRQFRWSLEGLGRIVGSHPWFHGKPHVKPSRDVDALLFPGDLDHRGLWSLSTLVIL